jgi:pimeloyl-ACP methyl ester carboxylesterase
VTDLWWRADGEGPAALLINGADTPSSAWPATMLDGLLAAGRRVIRFDHAGVGRSPARAPVDDLHALVEDAVAVLDAAGAGPAHIVGSSLGAMVAQLLALDHPTRVSGLTLLITTATPGEPPPLASYLDAAGELAFSDAADDPVAWARLLAGTRYPFDAAAVAPFPAVDAGHRGAAAATPPWHHRLGGLAVPTTVIGGRADPIFPPPHSERLAALIPDARLVMVDGLGHEVPAALFTDLSALWGLTPRSTQVAEPPAYPLR